MKYTDIAIIGGGLAGSTAAAMLGRAGIATILVDPHPVYPPDFRVEKLSGDEQIARFHKTGLGDRKSTRLNSSHMSISYAVFCLKKKKHKQRHQSYTELFPLQRKKY